MIKKTMNILLAFLIILACFGCHNKEDVSMVDDNYRNVYEIFVGSFRDSDGDKKGDLNGVTGELDYIQDMGYTAIWLMPIHPSVSYHKYDVADYYGIDSSYGTMEDFENLLKEAHKRNIDVYMDLVVNHTSNQHPWFLQGAQAYYNGTDSPYIEYYNFIDEYRYGYSEYRGIYYEARFTYSMPELNLDSPKVREEIAAIMKFWLDKGVDGFRLDATTSFYTGEPDKNVEFLSWINETAKSIKEDCYIVGECWENNTTVKKYYTSGIDSFFYFDYSQGEGLIVKAMKAAEPATQYRSILTNALTIANGHIPAIFLDNHDVNRITNAIGSANMDQLKFVYGLSAMFNGSVYTYYGTEIGMIGSKNDPNRRIAMLWDSDKKDELCDNPEGTTAAKYVFKGVEQQKKDENSILNYSKQVNYLRNKFPQIARGEITVDSEHSDSSLLIIEKKWNDESIGIVINFDRSNSVTVDCSHLEYKKCEYAAVYSTDEARFKNGTLELPAYGIAILYR